MNAKNMALRVTGLTAALGLLVLVLTVVLASGHRSQTANGTAAASDVNPLAAFGALRSDVSSAGTDAALRRTQETLARAGDAIPAELQDVTVARYLGESSGLDFYVVAGTRTVCLDTVPHGALKGMSVACGHSPEATNGHRPIGGVSDAGAGNERVDFLVPDGVTNVLVDTPDGSSYELPVKNNLASRVIPGKASSVRWTASGGRAEQQDLSNVAR